MVCLVQTHKAWASVTLLPHCPSSILSLFPPVRSPRGQTAERVDAVSHKVQFTKELQGSNPIWLAHDLKHGPTFPLTECDQYSSVWITTGPSGMLLNYRSQVGPIALSISNKACTTPKTWTLLTFGNLINN